MEDVVVPLNVWLPSLALPMFLVSEVDSFCQVLVSSYSVKPGLKPSLTANYK